MGDGRRTDAGRLVRSLLFTEYLKKIVFKEKRD